MDRVDRAIGDGIATAVRAKHRRRLGRLSSPVLDAPPDGWAEDGPPPRLGNRVDVLIDGETALAAIVERLHSGWTEHGGGGIWWRRRDDFKNVPANGPAAILLARLGAMPR